MHSRNLKFNLCLGMVRLARTAGIRAAARILRSSRNTVRKWLRRFEPEGFAGLHDRSRAPRRIPHKTPPEQQRRVLDARDAIPCFGPAG